MPRLYIATNGPSIWYSDDLGESLVRMQSQTGLYSGSQVWALASSAQSPQVVLAGTKTGLYRLEPAHGAWSHIPSLMDGRLITAISFSPHDPSPDVRCSSKADVVCLLTGTIQNAEGEPSFGI